MNNRFSVVKKYPSNSCLRLFESVYPVFRFGLMMTMMLLVSPALQAAARDLSLTVSSLPASAVANGELTYTLTVTNNGTKPVRNVVLINQLPQSVTFKTASVGCKFLNKQAKRNKKLTCKTGRILPSANVVWSILVTPTQSGSITNTANVRFDKPDPTPDNNRVTTRQDILPAGNQAPSATPLSQTADPAVPYLDAQLSASDPDNDTLTYELVSAASGTGYSLAYVNPNSGKLYVSFESGYQGPVGLSYRVTDGKLFSPEASIQLLVQLDTGDKGTGGQEIDPKTYAGFDRSRLASNLFGSPGAPPTEPPLVDLSSNFPTPGDQGQQGSCVGWATTYALKSFHEGIEMGWALNTPSRLFSPAYVYNQINGGQDGGSQIYDALDLIIAQGAATLATMPYTDQNFTAQPSQAARTEAARFKALKRSTLNGLSDIKGALAQRKPVVLGIEVFDQFYKLKGTNSVYNSTDGNNTGQHGRHAVTAVGYDNNHPSGGALRVINSWSTNWGHNGFFWMPYNMVPKVVFQAWTMDDGPNTDVPVNPDPPPPPPPGKLPDLQVQSWEANYDSNIGGSGDLAWSVINAGQGDAPTGVTVSLILSKDTTFSANDTYVVYEEIPFDMPSGESAFRSFAEGNEIAFQIPQTIEPGNYYMTLVVDDLDRVTESDETNNVSLSNDLVTLSANQSNLYVDTWYANWDDFSGDGSLTFDIYNDGNQTSAAGWTVGLLLTPISLSSTAYTLFEETIPFTLDPSERAYRDDSIAAYFNLYRDTQSKFIPTGLYYMVLYADRYDEIPESDELDNESYSWGFVTIGFGASADKNASTRLATTLASTSGSPWNGEKRSSAYNGKRLPDKNAQVRTVRIGTNEAGLRTLEILDQAPTEGKVVKAAIDKNLKKKFQKNLHAQDRVIFPITNLTPMPAAPKP